MKQTFKRLHGVVTTRNLPCDIWLVITALTLAAIGWVMVSSASIGLLDNSYHYLRQHGIFLFIAICAALVVVSLPMEVWRQNAGLLMIISIALLMLVLVIGQTVNGSTRWIALPGPLPSIQVSEFGKLGLIIYMSAFLTRFVDELRQKPFSVFRPLMILAVPGFFLLLAPDFGGAVVYTVCVIGMVVMAGASLVLIVLIGGVLFVGFVLLVVMEPYRLARWTSFLDPWADQFATGYQLTQALIAFGRGHVTGTGLGNSVQKLHYLPEAHTDFIFAVLAEEMGMIGAISLILLFTVFILRALIIARRAELAGHLFGAYVGYGVAFVIAAQAYINMAVSSGSLPTKGLTLPLISYGGSSLLVTAVMIGFLLRIDVETRQRSKRVPLAGLTHRKPQLS